MWQLLQLPDIVAFRLPLIDITHHQKHDQNKNKHQHNPYSYDRGQFYHTHAKGWFLIGQLCFSGWTQATRCTSKLVYYYGAVWIHLIKLFVNRNDRFCQNPQVSCVADLESCSAVRGEELCLIYNIILCCAQEQTTYNEATIILALTELSYSLSNELCNAGSLLFDIVILKKMQCCV